MIAIKFTAFGILQAQSIWQQLKGQNSLIKVAPPNQTKACDGIFLEQHQERATVRVPTALTCDRRRWGGRECEAA